MKLNNKQQGAAKARFIEEMATVEPSTMKGAAKAAAHKLSRLSYRPPISLAQWWQELKLMVRLVNDYRKGRYTAVPWKVIAAIVAALIYFVSPLDVLPDFIPFIGYLDDAFVIKLALDFARSDLSLYSQWQAQQTAPTEH